MVPIHKKGSRLEASIYRGIVSLCACAKVFELLLYKPLLTAVHNYLSPSQHGFLPKRFSATNLVEFVGYCYDNIDRGIEVDAAYIDCKAAVDNISQVSNLVALALLPVHPETLKLITKQI